MQLCRLGSLVGLTAILAAPAFAFGADEISETFKQGVQALRKGDEGAALKAFQKVLALDPSNEAAYELWKSTDHEIWLEILVKQGDFELVAKRLMGLAELGRMQRKDDSEAIKALLTIVAGADVLERRAAIRTLGAEHGEYAVPHMLPTLADASKDERRVLFMNALTEMGDDVVLPLIEALESPDPFLRRNVALTLGYIGDSRALPMLATSAALDPDASAALAAKEALGKCGSSQGALADLLAQGNAYLLEDPNVLRPHQISGVVWTLEAGVLTSAAVPSALYNEELAKKSFYRALKIDAGAVGAYAGLARVLAGEQQVVREWASLGMDVEVLQASVDRAALALGAAGSLAQDEALMSCIDQGDTAAGIGLCHSLGRSATHPTPGLLKALDSGDGALRSEAAAALGQIALLSHQSASVEVITALGESAGREVLRFAVIIDAHADRAQALGLALQKRGIASTIFGSGTAGLVGLRRLPGVDLVLLAEDLSDLPSLQVQDELSSDERLANVPLLVVAKDAEAASELWSDHSAGIVTSGADLKILEDVLKPGMGRDREQAAALARRSALLLSQLAQAGSDLGPALGGLSIALRNSADEIAVPALQALQHAGTPAQLPALLEVVQDEGRSAAVHTSAAIALGGVFGRYPGSGADAVGVLSMLAGRQAASVDFREALMNALGRMQLDAATRAGLLRGARVEVRAE